LLLDRAISRPPAGPSAQGGVARVTSMAQWHPYSAASLCLHQNGWLQTIAALLLRTGNDRAPIPPAFLQSRRRLICPPQQRSPRTNFPTHFRSSEGLALGLAWAGEGGKQATPHAGPPIEAPNPTTTMTTTTAKPALGLEKGGGGEAPNPCPLPMSMQPHDLGPGDDHPRALIRGIRLSTNCCPAQACCDQMPQVPATAVVPVARRETLEKPLVWGVA